MAVLCVAMKYTPAQYYALTIAEREALVKVLNQRK